MMISGDASEMIKMVGLAVMVLRYFDEKNRLPI